MSDDPLADFDDIFDEDEDEFVADDDMVAVATAPPAYAAERMKGLSQQTFRFDSVTAVMIAGIVLTGLAVLFLGAVWASNQVWFVEKPPMSVEVVTIRPRPIEDGPEGASGSNFGETVTMNANEITEGDGSDPTTDGSSSNFLSNVVTAAGSMALTAVPTGEVGERAPGGGGGGGVGGHGTGTKGTGEGSGIIPRNLRWLVRYEGSSKEVYQKQLDFFKIELGVVQTAGVTMVSRLGDRKPTVRAGNKNEDRLYFAWVEPERRRFDTELLQKAGINAENSTIVHFYSLVLEDQLATLEEKFQGKKPEHIRSTRFSIREVKGGFEFYVFNQTLVK